MDRLRSGLYRIHIRSTIRYIALYLLLFLSVVLKDENYEKYRDIYNSLFFGRGPNRVIEMDCLIQSQAVGTQYEATRLQCLPRDVSRHSIYPRYMRPTAKNRQYKSHWEKQTINWYWKIIVLAAHGVNVFPPNHRYQSSPFFIVQTIHMPVRTCPLS